MAKINTKPMEIVYEHAEGSFWEGKAYLESKDFQVISLKQNAEVRMHKGKDDIFSIRGNYVKERILSIPGKGNFLTKIPFSLQESEHDLYLNDKQIEKALADSIKLPDENFNIPTKEFGKNEVFIYAFGKEFSEKYGSFLDELGILEMPFWVYDLQDKSLVRPLWFGGLSDGPGIFTYDLILGYELVEGVLGVKSRLEDKSKETGKF
jgi:hypothetical protein